MHVIGNVMSWTHAAPCRCSCTVLICRPDGGSVVYQDLDLNGCLATYDRSDDMTTVTMVLWNRSICATRRCSLVIL